MIGSAISLSVVGLLNYMGQAEVPDCSAFNSEKNDEKIDDRNLDAAYIPGVMIRDNLSDANDGSYDSDGEDLVENGNNDDWTNIVNSELDHVDIQPVFDEYDFNGNLMKAMPDDVVLPTTTGSILNHPDCASLGQIKYEDAIAAFDLRESYMQRHLSPLASQAEQTELNTKQFNTQSCNVWKTDDISLYPDSTNEVTGQKNNNIY